MTDRFIPIAQIVIVQISAGNNLEPAKYRIVVFGGDATLDEFITPFPIFTIQELIHRGKESSHDETIFYKLGVP